MIDDLKSATPPSDAVPDTPASTHPIARPVSDMVVGLVGRPNVGKSTLFNRLTRTKRAIVEDSPGVTRDFQKLPARIGEVPFILMDMAGLESAGQQKKSDALTQRIQAHAERSLAEADIFLYLLDATAGIQGEDETLLRRLRRLGKPIILAMNKAEGRKVQGMDIEAHRLGLGAPLLISSAHGMGMDDLYEALIEAARNAHFIITSLDQDAPESEDEAPFDPDAPEPEEDTERPIRMAIVGRPNAGKSTLFNKLLKQERSLTGPEAGLTRDAIEERIFGPGGRPIDLIDTAGLRRRARIEDATTEYFSVGRTLEAVRFAQVVILVMDATIRLEKQDLTIASHVVEEGRALILALNKWDLVTDADATLKAARQDLAHVLPQVKDVPLVPLVATTGDGLPKLLRVAMDLYTLWGKRISTGALNRWLQSALEAHSPPMSGDRRLKIRYITQIKSRPPTFALFMNRADGLPDSYLRYLENRLRDDFGLKGVPLRLWTRQGFNPYKK